MEKSRLDKNYQTTVPREVRDELGLGPGDVLLWEVVDGAARVRPETRAFLALRGSIRVGPGSTVEDIRRARRQRGLDYSSKVVERAAAGEEIGTANAGRPLARLEPSESQSVPRRPGAWKGQVWVAEDFDAPLPPEIASGDEKARKK
jgi:bifunctional DNA-binding transcriptional regulator/antitoxin component of YhaV-PrlF toxin-antitoxin module